MLHPEEQLSLLLDGRRTTNPLGCYRSRLTKPTTNFIFEVEDNSSQGLNAQVGDPIVVLSDLEHQETKLYAIVEKIENNTITVVGRIPESQVQCDAELNTPDVVERNELRAKINPGIPQFVKGAIIQNLANRWHPERRIVGAKTQLKRPSAPTFTIKRILDGVEILISIPITLSATSSYDVYVRDHPFHSLQLHWIPDILDAPEVSDRLVVTTYNGGIDAGGGTAAGQEHLYAAVVAKDKIGFTDATESSFTTQRVS